MSKWIRLKLMLSHLKVASFLLQSSQMQTWGGWNHITVALPCKNWTIPIQFGRFEAGYQINKSDSQMSQEQCLNSKAYENKLNRLQSDLCLLRCTETMMPLSSLHTETVGREQTPAVARHPILWQERFWTFLDSDLLQSYTNIRF